MISVSVNQADFDRVIHAIDSVERVVLGLKDSIPEEMAREFSDTLVRNITSQKFGDFGERRVSTWKKGMSNENSFWLFMGTALKSIRPRKLGSSPTVTKWFVGFDYSGGGSSSSSQKLDKNKRLDLIKKRATSFKRRMAESTSNSPVRHIDPRGYVPSKKSTSQSLSRGGTANFGYAPSRIIKKREDS